MQEGLLPERRKYLSIQHEHKLINTKELKVSVDEIVIYSKDRKDIDIIAGPKKKGQKIPFRLSIRLKLPQDILSEISQQKDLIEPTYYPPIKKAPGLTDASSSQNDIASGANNTPFELFEILQNNAEILKKWNKEVNLFIHQEKQPSNIKVTY